MIIIFIYTLCLKKHVTTFLNISWTRTWCSFTQIFGALITKTLGHRQVFLVSHLTYFMHLLYLVNCRDLNIMNLALNCWFSQCHNTRIVTAKLSPYYFTYLLPGIQLTVYSRTITRFIANDKVVYQRVRREMRLASDDSWARRRLKHLSSRITVNYPVHTRAREISRADRCFFRVVLLAEHEVGGPPLLRAERGLPLPGCRTLLYNTLATYHSCRSSSADCRCFQVSNTCRAIHPTAFVHQTVFRHRDF